MVLGNVEEIITLVDINEETYEEVIRVMGNVLYTYATITSSNGKLT